MTMTTNQTIDGELRELLVRILSYTWFPSGDIGVFDLRLIDREQLRALLDAPAVESELDRLRAENERLLAGFYQQVTDADIKKISDYMGNPDMPTGAFLRQDAYDLANMTTHMCREVQALRDKLAAQPQGKPVARVEIGADRNAALTITDENWLRSLKDRGAHQLVPLYAEQPAPVAVVLPERMQWDGLRATACNIRGEGWNACLDELKRLNTTRPAHANPPPGTEPCGTHHDNDGLDEMRKPAMCDCNQGRLECRCKP